MPSIYIPAKPRSFAQDNILEICDELVSWNPKLKNDSHIKKMREWGEKKISVRGDRETAAILKVCEKRLKYWIRMKDWEERVALVQEFQKQRLFEREQRREFQKQRLFERQQVKKVTLADIYEKLEEVLSLLMQKGKK